MTARFEKDIQSLGIATRFRILLRVAGKDALSVEPLFYQYRKRWFLHMLVFYGFVGLMFTTTLDDIVNHGANPLPLDSPVKILGNISGLALIIGATPMLLRGFKLTKNNSESEPLSFADRVFLPVLYLATLTGFLTEILDYGGIIIGAETIYFIHIGVVTALLASAPWTRFVHSLQAPFLTLYERLRQNVAPAHEDTDYKRLALAEYVKNDFYSNHTRKAKEKELGEGDGLHVSKKDENENSESEKQF